MIDIVLYIFKTLKFDNYTAQISLRDPNNKEKYIGSDENWEKAESAIMQAAKEKGLTTVVELGEAAFYGPKLDFMVLPISEKFNDYAQKVSEFLNRSDVRTEVDDRNEKIGRKIRDNELKRIPYLLIVGEKEEAEGLVSVRAQGEGDKGQMSLEAFRDFIAGLVKEEIEANKLEKK